MNGGQTKNAALTTTLAFHYQVLIGLEQCFELKEGQSVWFEKDGDVSLVGDPSEGSKQIESKLYSGALTDHHENLWKTLKNWLAPEFEHEKYGALVLHTTQAFGTSTRLRGWNSQNGEQRVKILQSIFDTRTQEEITTEQPVGVICFQKEVMGANPEHLKPVLEKVFLFTEAENSADLRAKISSKPIGIPESNKERYLQNLVGFVYDKAGKTCWCVNKLEFDAKCEELTSTYCKKEYTFPLFVGIEATGEQVTLHKDALFVQKIYDIEHYSVVPDAIGNWIELQNSLSEQLDEYPLYREKTENYQRQLVKRFKLDFSSAQLSCTDVDRDSKLFYNHIIREIPLNVRSDTPPIEYKNGLIHDAMDNNDHDLKWKIEL